MIEILELSNGKVVHIDGNEITQDEAHEIIIKLTEAWGPTLRSRNSETWLLASKDECV